MSPRHVLVRPSLCSALAHLPESFTVSSARLTCSLGHFACKRVPVGDDHAWLEKGESSPGRDQCWLLYITNGAMQSLSRSSY